MTVSAIELSPQVQQDFDRILNHLVEHEVVDMADRVLEIMEAIDILAHHPYIGRPVSKGNRELVIGRDSHGYVARYCYVAKIDTVFVLAVRSQREAGYAGE